MYGTVEPWPFSTVFTCPRHARGIGASIRSAESVDKVTSGPELANTVKRIDQLTQRLDGTLGTVDRSSTSLEAILARVERGEGTLGKLSKDEQLYKNATDATANMNKAAEELQKLVGDFRANPRKYVNLKIF